MNVLDFIKCYLEDHRGDWPRIVKEAGVSYTWATKVVQGKIKNPGIRDLQKLLDYIEAQGGQISLLY